MTTWKHITHEGHNLHVTKVGTKEVLVGGNSREGWFVNIATSRGDADLPGKWKTLKAAKAAGLRAVRAKGTKKNPTTTKRPRILWFKVGPYQISVTAKGNETVRKALHRSYLADTGYAMTNLTVSKPQDVGPGAWRGMIAKHAVYMPQRGAVRKNP